MDPKNVNKALSPDETALISNIQSLINELLSISSGSAGGAPAVNQEVASKEASPDAMTEEEKKKAEKEITETGTDASTASDNAKERVDGNQAMTDEENVKEVAKALLSVLGKKEEGKKPIDPIVKTLGDLSFVIQKMKEDQGVIAKTLENVLKATGVIDQIQVIEKSTLAPENKNVDLNTIAHVANLINQINKAQGNQTENTENIGDARKTNGEIARKNLANTSVLKSLFPKAWADAEKRTGPKTL